MAESRAKIYTDIDTEWDNMTNGLHDCRMRIMALEARLGLLIPDDIESLYTEQDINIFQDNLNHLRNVLADQDFLSLVDKLAASRNEDDYSILYEYVNNKYPGFALNVCDSCNGILFLSERRFDTEMFSWNIGGRSEIVMAMMAVSYECPRKIPFFGDLLTSGFGYSRRTRFIDLSQTDTKEYHFICKQVVIGDRILFIVVREH